MASYKKRAIVLLLFVVAETFSAPALVLRRRNVESDTGNNMPSPDDTKSDVGTNSFPPIEEKKDEPSTNLDDADDDFFDEPVQRPSAGGSNIFSLLNLANSLFSTVSNNVNQTESSPLWRLKTDIWKAFIRFGFTVVGRASSFVISAATTND